MVLGFNHRNFRISMGAKSAPVLAGIGLEFAENYMESF
jgi:Fe-S cluster assembly iron-binding protein IscA